MGGHFGGVSSSSKDNKNMSNNWATMSQPIMTISNSKQKLALTNQTSESRRSLLGLINVDRIQEVKRTAEKMQHLASLRPKETSSNSVLERFANEIKVVAPK